ncbi:unnamed protein product [Darwinula stevensoni]|uniref:Uncharacterized protein n=1 Tax=Darwinula stevensoni TaxID=69355 RepID=A0A7R9ACM3_9CRUS|nr:unnamed protein product [Darwinula stevensoni]CAG0900224.1 unnamed protein product [Darwinula stevensoni]
MKKCKEMEVPTVKGCCFGCLSNREGSIAIAVFQLVSNCSFFFLSLNFLFEAIPNPLHEPPLSMDDWHQRIPCETQQGPIRLIYFTEEPFVEQMNTFLKLLPAERRALVFALSSLTTIIVASLLIHGIRKGKKQKCLMKMFQNKRKLMIPWLGFAFVVLLVGGVSAIVTILSMISENTENSLLVCVFLLCIVIYSVGVHIFLVVYSYFKELGSQAQHGPAHTQRSSKRSEEIEIHVSEDAD